MAHTTADSLAFVLLVRFPPASLWIILFLTPLFLSTITATIYHHPWVELSRDLVVPQEFENFVKLLCIVSWKFLHQWHLRVLSHIIRLMWPINSALEHELTNYGVICIKFANYNNSTNLNRVIIVDGLIDDEPIGRLLALLRSPSRSPSSPLS